MTRSILPQLAKALLAATAISSFMQADAAAAPAGSVTQLSVRPGDVGLVTYALSGDGKVVVGYLRDAGLHSVAAYWSSNGAVTAIPLAATDTYLRGVSDDGLTMVGRYETFGVGSGAFVYHQGTVYDLTLANQASTANAANAITPDGSIIVGSTDFGGGHAAMWSGPNWSNLTDLGLLPTGTYSYANGVDASGTTVVGNGDKADGYGHAFYWQGGAMTELMSPEVRAYAPAISRDGSTIIGNIADAAFTVQHAVAWTGPGYTTVTDLGTLGGPLANATGVSADGSVIVGSSSLANNADRAFRYANGTMADLNDLLTGAGVDLGGVVLRNATGISANGAYISASSSAGGYLVYYGDGIGGLTNQAQQQASVDALGRQRQALAIQHDAYAGILTGDLDRKGQSNDVGVFGLVGSVVGGVHGHLGLGNGFSFSGGLMDGTSSFGGAGIGNGFLGAAALRYDSEAEFGGFTPYAQIGGSLGVLSDVEFTRDYVGGIGIGKTDGSLAALYARLGITRTFDSGDTISADVELGSRWLSTGAYAEEFSATNPFPATVDAGTDQQTIAKVGGSWTHPLADNIDVTLHAAIGATLDGSSGLAVNTTGFGSMTTGSNNPIWGEFGAHAAWTINEHSSVDLYATGMAGGDIGTNLHVGAGYRYKF